MSTKALCLHIALLASILFPGSLALYGDSSLSDAYINQRPYMATLLDANRNTTRGAAAILSPNYFLTSARVLEPADVQYVSYGGVIFDPNVEGLLDGSISFIDEKIFHPAYIAQFKPRNEDFPALARSATFINFGPNLQPIRIASAAVEVSVGTPFTVCGWGERENRVRSSKLVCGRFYRISEEDCAQRYDRWNVADIFVSGGICGVGVTGGQERWCQYDDGSPLVAGDLIVGIAQTGDSCLGRFFPSLAVPIADYAGWITAKIGYL